jgi:hypothetical protein
MFLQPATTGFASAVFLTHDGTIYTKYQNDKLQEFGIALQ